MHICCLCVSSVNPVLGSADMSVTDGGQKGRMEQNHVKSSKSMDLGKTALFPHITHIKCWKRKLNTKNDAVYK